MIDSDQSESRKVQLLERIATLLDRERLGLIDDPPGRRTIYAHRNSDSLWHFWDSAEEARIPIEKEAVRGVLTDCFCYVKRSAEGESTKVRVRLQCASAEYEIETSLHATSGRGLMSGLLEAGDEIDRPITIGVRPADKEQVLFMDVYTDASGLQISDDHIGAGDEQAALDAVRTVRQRLGLSPDPFDNRLADRNSRPGAPSGSAANPSADPRGSASAQQGGGSAVQQAAQTKDDVDWRDAPEKILSTLKTWNAKLSNEAAYRDLQEKVNAIEEQVRGQWPPACKKWAFSMLDKHEKRLREMERETFEPDEELPF